MRYEIDGQHLTGIANAIRAKTGKSALLTPEQMPDEISSISGSPILQEKTATENGIVLPDGGYDGLSKVTVTVSGGGGGKYSGSAEPAASLGNDGDIYERAIPIPSNVNFVEYLESSGTQYIDTGITANQFTDMRCKFLWRGNTYIAGVRTGSATSMQNAITAVAGPDRAVGMVKTTSSADWEGFTKTAVDGIPTEVSSFTKIYENGYSALLDVDSTHFARTGQANFTSNGSIILFGIRNSGSIAKASKCRLYRVSLWQYGSPIADYLPCLDGNGVACMWDNIAQEYVYNDGTGDFAYGSTVTPDALDPVYYIKNNGSWEVIQQ